MKSKAISGAVFLIVGIMLLNGCSSSSNSSPDDDFKIATLPFLQNQTGQEPPDWLILHPGSVVTLGWPPIRGPETICDGIDVKCRDHSATDKEYTVDNIVPYQDVALADKGSRYAVHLRGLGWVGAGGISPVVPTGTVIQNGLCDRSDDDCSHHIYSGADKEEGGTHVVNYTLLRVDGDNPGHLNYLHVIAISGSIAGTNGFVSWTDGYGTPSGYDLSVFVSVIPGHVLSYGGTILRAAHGFMTIQSLNDCVLHYVPIPDGLSVKTYEWLDALISARGWRVVQVITLVNENDEETLLRIAAGSEMANAGDGCPTGLRTKLYDDGAISQWGMGNGSGGFTLSLSDGHTAYFTIDEVWPKLPATVRINCYFDCHDSPRGSLIGPRVRVYYYKVIVYPKHVELVPTKVLKLVDNRQS